MTTDRPLIRKIRDYIFGTFAFPLAFDVGGLFWLLYAIDRELVSSLIKILTLSNVTGRFSEGLPERT